MRLALVTNIPAPYRVPVLNALARDPQIEFRVFYMAATEADRRWDLPPIEHPHEFLKPNVTERRGRFIHNNPDVWSALKRFRPNVLITNGYNPTHLYAFAYSQLSGCVHVAMTDGTLESEASLGRVHRLLRRIVLARSPTAIVVSDGGRRLLDSYGVDPSRIYLSPLCANSEVAWNQDESRVQDLDFLFSGRLVDVKNPLFALDVAQGVSRRLGRRVSLGMLGSGPLEGAIRERAASMVAEVDLRMAGHVSQADIPAWFLRSRVFLFPTSWDPWGVVANEACLAGLPIVVSPHAGVSNELVREGKNGLIRPLERDAWVEAAFELLSNEGLYAEMSRQAVQMVAPYSPENAARGMAEATKRAWGGLLPPAASRVDASAGSSR